MLIKNDNQRCPYCLGLSLRPKGWNRKRTKRRYKCADCQKHITQRGRDWFVSDEQIVLINALLLERLSLRGICRVVGLCLRWLMSYIKKLYTDQSEGLYEQYRKSPNTDRHIAIYELDEMWSYVGNKKNKQWIWIAQCRESRQVVAFHIGGRGRDDAKELWNKIPDKLKPTGKFYTDDWEAYKTVLPEKQHFFSKQKRDTNHIERLNNTIRQRVSRLVRKTLSFSKSIRNHIGALRYFFYHYNMEQQALRKKTKSAHL